MGVSPFWCHKDAGIEAELVEGSMECKLSMLDTFAERTTTVIG